MTEEEFGVNGAGSSDLDIEGPEGPEGPGGRGSGEFPLSSWMLSGSLKYSFYPRSIDRVETFRVDVARHVADVRAAVNLPAVSDDQVEEVVRGFIDAVLKSEDDVVRVWFENDPHMPIIISATDRTPWTPYEFD